jgi:hypothetical protein
MRKNETKPLTVSLSSLKKASIALEDLALALQRVRPDQLMDAIEVMNQVIMTGSPRTQSAVARTYESEDANKRFLIGVLPRLLQDRDLFPSNEDITEFATAVLRLPMTSTAGMKRARHEIIGKVICETDLLDEEKLTLVVMALERLVGNTARLDTMIREKRAGVFSWNETLQDLLRS